MVRTRKQRQSAPSTPEQAPAPAPAAAAATPKRRGGGIGSYLNMSTLATAACVAYIGFAFRNFARMMDPLADLPEEYWTSGGRVTPLWVENSTLEVEVAVSTLPSLDWNLMRNETAYAATTVVVWREAGIEFSVNTPDRSVALQLCASDQGPHCSDDALAAAEAAAAPSLLARAFLGSEKPVPRRRATLPPAAWAQLRRNGTLYLHSAVSKITDKAAAHRGLADNNPHRSARVPSIGLIKFEPAPTGRAATAPRKLLADVHPALGRLGPPAPWAPDWTGTEGQMAAKWKPEAAVRIVAEFRDWPETLRMPGMQRLRERAGPGQGVRYRYAPPTYADEIGLTSDKYIPVNASVDHLPLTVSFQPLSFARWQLISRMAEGVKAQQEDMGFSDNDVDEVRRLVADTKTTLLAITMLASVLHLLFEFLAFKSDVEFWKKNTSLRGLSARSVVVDLISQIVVLAYLVDQGASLLVSVPAFGAICIQCWKVEKATGLRFDASRRYLFKCARLERLAEEAAAAAPDDRGAALDAATLRVDRLATLYLTIGLGPLVVGYAVKTLVYDAHLGWYSWALGALTNAVYTGGFILMTPQLALNYNLKSVSHLPWKLLCFRFVNTFIDDLFAFVIKMPMMHRVSCFRDDVVFLIYLYQRRIYDVDMSRGVAGEDAGD